MPSRHEKPARLHLNLECRSHASVAQARPAHSISRDAIPPREASKASPQFGVPKPCFGGASTACAHEVYARTVFRHNVREATLRWHKHGLRTPYPGMPSRHKKPARLHLKPTRRFGVPKPRFGGTSTACAHEVYARTVFRHNVREAMLRWRKHGLRTPYPGIWPMKMPGIFKSRWKAEWDVTSQ